MKQISEAQIKEIMQVLMNLNIPVQTYSSFQDMFNKLPVITKEDEATNTK